MRGRGFYGNVSNASKSQFIFDRHYSNRTTMDQKVHEDGVFVGRYVLVEYDYPAELKKYYLTQQGNFATANSDDINLRLGTSQVIKDEIICIPAANNYRDDNPQEDLFYKCTGFEKETNIAIFIEEVADPYAQNYHIDMATYGAGRGYDSTVWQKVFDEKVEKYVMIAELNSVIPTFDISADAPTMEPLPPHFDQNSTNTYYNMHVQNPYGFRVQKATPAEGESIGKSVPSDVETTWDKVNYDPSTGEVHVVTSEPAPAAIYFNKAGFNDKVSTHNNNDLDIIEIKPTGISGKTYNSHNGHPAITAPDIQELKVVLPSIGNSIATMWDIIYGVDRNQDINWDSTVGHRAVRKNADGYTFTPEETKTLAGCINSIHDLMGMIIESNDTIIPETADLNKIYYKNKEFYYVRPTYKYTSIQESEFDKSNGIYYVIDNQLMPEVPLYSKWNNIAGYKQGLAVANESKELIKLEGFANSLNTIHGLIVKINQILNTGNIKSRDTNTVQGCINTLNDIIANFSKYDLGDVLIVNENGQFEGGPIITKESSIAYWNEGTQMGVSTSGRPDSVIKAQINTKAGNPSITLNHANRKQYLIADTTTTADKNTGGGDGLNAKADGKINLYTPIIDNFGHIVARNTETIKLPNAYKEMQTNGTSTSDTAITTNANSMIASTPYSTFSINTGNKFIETSINNNVLTLGHKVEDITKNTKVEGENSEDGLMGSTQSFTTSKINGYDAAGHITNITEQTVNFPYNFGYLKAKNSFGVYKAESVQDTLTFTNDDNHIDIQLGQGSSVIFNHTDPQTTVTTKGETSTRAITWGESFKTLQVGIDNKGHISNLQEYNITLPRFNSNSTKITDSSVVTGLIFDDVNGSLETVIKNVGEVKLAGYVNKVAKSKEQILPGDTINQALAKLHSRLWTIEDGTITDVKYTYLKKQTTDIVHKYGEYETRFTDLDTRIVNNTNNIAKNTEDIASILGGTAGSLTSILAEAKQYTDGKVTIINAKDATQDQDIAGLKTSVQANTNIIQEHSNTLTQLTGADGKVKAAEIADKAIADNMGNNIVNTYETKLDAQTKRNQSHEEIKKVSTDIQKLILYYEYV